MTVIEPALIERLRQLPPHKVAEVGDFIDFLRAREDDRRLTRATSKTAEAARSDPDDQSRHHRHRHA